MVPKHLSRLTRREALCLPLAASMLRGATVHRRCDEVKRFPAPEANQAVAADEEFLYGIGNHVIVKMDKKTGKPVSKWECENGKPLIHLDSGVVHEGVLYCAHSNFPGVPMVSSIETWDVKSMKHAGSYSFGIYEGSATWIDIHQGYRYVTFAHYKLSSDEPTRDPRWTTLVQFNTNWQRLQAWVYPAEVVSKLGDYSISGGVFTPDHKLFCSGHDNPEVYVFTFPEGGSVMVLEDTFAMPMKGQGIAIDPLDASILYGIDRPKREIIVTKVTNA